MGAIDPAVAGLVAKHFESMELKTRILSSPEATELAKLTETTYFGLMIAWAQEVERYCDQSGQDYNEVAAFGGNQVLSSGEILPGGHRRALRHAEY